MNMKRLLVFAAAVAAAVVCLTPPPTTRVLAEVTAPDSALGNGIVEQNQPCAPAGSVCEDWFCTGKSYCHASGICGEDLKCHVVGEYACICDLAKCNAECVTDVNCPPALPVCTDMKAYPLCTCIEKIAVGGIAEVAGADASALGTTDSGSSSGATYAVMAGIAAGVVLLAAGGWYARRRWLS
jgi:hypothetical protein